MELESRVTPSSLHAAHSPDQDAALVSGHKVSTAAVVVPAVPVAYLNFQWVRSLQCARIAAFLLAA
jgi:hypothetical protein